MRQWLYNHGDECKHNTGGWIKCSNKREDKPVSTDNGVLSAKMVSSVSFLVDRIAYVCEAEMPIRFSSGVYYRPGLVIESTLGTKSPLVKDIAAYRKMMVSNSNKLTGTFRVGAANAATTSIITATIVQSGTANDMNLAMETNHPFLVLGNRYTYDVQRSGGGIQAIKLNNDCEITEIWLE